jgi:hypothetical protein
MATSRATADRHEYMIPKIQVLKCNFGYDLAITLQLLYGFGLVLLRPHTRNIHLPSRSQRSLKQLLENIRKPNIARGHPLRLVILILSARV